MRSIVRITALIQIATLWALSPRADAQEAVSRYPQDYFRNPLDIPILLAGNFGECRPNHFHSGMDIKTNGIENLVVRAAADGYISRMKIERGGFGHALYITHPNGFTTLYAHLNNFSPRLQQYLRTVQYQKESWTADISLKPDQFPVKKGEQIAWSGNTGGSTAPHLHLEIRDSKTEHPLNPQLFGFQVADTRPPVPLKLAVYDMTTAIYEQKPDIIMLKKSADGYGIPGDTLFTKSDTAGIGIGVNVNDYMNGSDNTLDFYTANWYLDDRQIGLIQLDNIGYDETRYLHAYADYRLYRERGEWYQSLFRLPGNRLQIYPVLQDDGHYHFSDNAVHKIRIVMQDAAGNSAAIMFYLKNTAVQAAGTTCQQIFAVNKVNSFSHPNVKFTMPETALYEPLCFDFSQTAASKGYSGQYHIHHPTVPVHSYFDLYLKPEVPIPFALRDKMVLMYTDGKDESGKGATGEDGWYKASVRAFGTYWLAADTVAPTIKIAAKEGAILSAAKTLSINVTEKITSVKSFRAELDGKWILFEPTGSTYTYLFDARCAKGRHELVINAGDENNNSAKLVYHFTR